jgi:hypothetical protein
VVVESEEVERILRWYVMTCLCKHDRKFHAIPEEHILGTSHCTKFGCVCKEYVEEVKKDG